VHHTRFHPTEPALKLERMQRNKTEDQMNQYGAGDIFSDRSDSGDEESDGEDADSMANNVGSDNDSESAMEDDEEDESKVFRFFVRQAKNELKKDGIHEVSHELLQEKFRELLISFLHWKDRLYKNPIYKKVMTNVRELQDEQFDRQEAIEAAVHNRRFLLNRVVPDPDDIDDSNDGEQENDEDSRTEDIDEGTVESDDSDQ
jgi:hypothetical protein